MTDATSTEESDPTDRLDPLTEKSERHLIRMLTGDSVPSPAEAASVDEIFDALRQPEKRFVLTYLLRSEGEITLSALVDYVLVKVDIRGDEEEFRQRVAAELTTTHLPALDEAGFIEYNVERQLLRAGTRAPQVLPYLKIALAQQRLLDDEQ
jgi:hypothetical protein